jgi:hypothetical protein
MTIADYTPFVERMINRKSEQHFTVYKVTNMVNGKTYVGAHRTKDLNDGYMGSGKGIKRAIRKYGLNSFKKEVMAVFDNPEDMFALERALVRVCHVSYNMNHGGLGGQTKEVQARATAKSRELFHTDGDFRDRQLKHFRENFLKGSKFKGRKGMAAFSDAEKTRVSKLGLRGRASKGTNKLVKQIVTCSCGYSSNLGNFSRWHTLCPNGGTRAG